MELKEYFDIVKRRIWIIILFTLTFAGVSAFVSFVMLEPIYQSNTTVYVGKMVDTQGGIIYNDLLVGTQLVKDYRELVKSRLVSNTVIEELGLYNMTASQLSAKLGVNLKSDTRIIEITAQDEEPELAKDIADKVAEVFKVKAVELMDVENVQIIDRAIVPSSPIKPKKQLNIIIAAFIGIMVGLGIVFLIEYLDNTIKTPEDVQKHIGIPVIGTIPHFTDTK